jgi:dolichol-phosphate mannosyltransferase
LPVFAILFKPPYSYHTNSNCIVTLSSGVQRRMRTIIIPTLNEEENIGRLIHSIFHHLGTKRVEIIVVDDNSSDQTQKIVRDLAKKSNSLSLIVRKGERGLGSAVRLGASRAKDGPAVVIDADISHHPRGGEIVGWSGSRIAISKIATLLARLLFRVRVKDTMSGFVGVRSTRLLSTGFKYANYKFMLEMIARFLLLIMRLLFSKTRSNASIRNLEGSLSARD